MVIKFPDKKYFNLVKEFSLAWFRTKDQRSILGLLWSFLNPLIMTGILFFLFKSRLRTGSESSYFLYILTGTVMWNFFAMATGGGLASLSDRADLVKNAAFPKEALVLGAIGEFLIQHLFELLVVFIFMVMLGAGFSIHIILLPFIICIEMMLISGVSLFLSCLCVYARDLKHIWNVIMRMAFFVVPVFYTIKEISPRFRWVVAINPISQIIIFSRDILLYHKSPSIANLIIVFAVSALVLMMGYRFFKYHEYNVAERV